MHRNGWSVAKTFDLDELVQTLPEFGGCLDVRVIPIEAFFNRVFQLGINNIT
jgi:hypothetical protein